MGDVQCARLLLDFGADPNTTTSRIGLTPAMTALNNENFDVFRLLIKTGADVNSKDREGKTLLHYIARLGCYELVEPVIGKGASLNVKDSTGATPLAVAIWHSYPTAVVLIRHGAIVDQSLLSDFEDTVEFLDIKEEFESEMYLIRGALCSNNLQHKCISKLRENYYLNLHKTFSPHWIELHFPEYLHVLNVYENLFSNYGCL